MGIWFRQVELMSLNSTRHPHLAQFLGIEFTEIGENYLKARMAVGPKTIQPYGTLHGGAFCVLAETVATVAANYCLDFTNYLAITTSIHSCHIRQVATEWVEAKASPVHIGSKSQIWEIHTTTERDPDKLADATRLIFAVIKRSEAF